MHSLATSLLLLVLSFTFAARHVSAADDSDTTIPAAVFTDTPSSSDAEYVFALNVDQGTGAIYFHLSAPAGNEWMAVGIGSQMKDALMFVAYPSKNGTGMTLSPRLGSGHYEPSYTKTVNCSLIYGLADANTVTGGDDGIMTVDAVCIKEPNLLGDTGSLDYTSTAENFIFAVGPDSFTGPGGNHHSGGTLQSNSLSAGLKRHSYYGHFTMDMTKAVSTNSSTAGVPKPNDSTNSTQYTQENASAAIKAQADNDPAPAIHAFVMCLTFVIIYPLGALILRLLKRVMMHAIVQTIGLVLTCMATAGGIVISTQYNRSRHFASAHQVIGILLLLTLFAQLGLGIIHHRIFKKEQRPTILGKIHRYLGPAVIVIGIINAPIGFVFAGNPHLCLPYVIILVLVALVFVGLRFFAHKFCGGRFGQRKAGQQNMPPGRPADNPEGYQYPQFGPASGAGGQAPYDHLGPPPAYGRSQSYGSDNIPLQPYESQNSGLEAHHPRPMV